MNIRVAAVALAASALFAAPAFADAPKALKYVQPDLLGAKTAVSTKVDLAQSYRHRDYRGDRRDSRYGNANGLRREAIQACRRAINTRADQIGFRDVDFDRDRYVDRIGPQGFLVHFPDVEFEGRRRDIERNVTCEVRRGRVVDLQGVPEWRRRAYRDYDRRDRRW